MDRQAFISCASEDRAIAERVCDLLERDGIGCWIAPRDVMPGDFGEQIIDAIESTRVMVLILSAHGNASKYVKNEVQVAFSKGRVVIPLRIQKVEPSKALQLFISGTQWIDAWTPPLEVRVRDLAAAIRRLLELPALQEDEPPDREPWTGSLRRGIAGMTRRLRSRPVAAAALLCLALALVSGAIYFGCVGPPSAHATFSTTGPMTVARGFHTATRLLDGRVLIAGGFNGSTEVGSAEVYDPKTGTFSPTGSMATARDYHTATLLPDGRVLIAGGSDGSVVLASAELYDPKTGTFSMTGPMTFARASNTATPLSNGRVLFGGDPDAFGWMDLYDPQTGSFSPSASMATGRRWATATLLPDGRALIAGGSDGSQDVASAHLYDPRTDSIGPTGSMATARTRHAAALLSDGRVLVAGGVSASALASAELYDPKTGKFGTTDRMTVGRAFHTATPLADGRVLIAGGSDDTGSAELYDPKTGSFSATGAMAHARESHTATALVDGRVLMVGGSNGSSYLASAELFQP